MAEWLVLLEVAADEWARRASGEVTKLRALDLGPHGRVFVFSDRYALQMSANGSSPVEALVAAVASWRSACRQLGVPAREVVRTEVFTPEDLERELAVAEDGGAELHEPESRTGAEPHDDVGNELLRRAFCDPLTGLLGRQAFVHRLAAELGGTGAQHHDVAVLCFCLDGFQSTVDGVGWAGANQLLMAVVQRLGGMVRPGDVLGRLGVDQYGVLLQGTGEETAVAVAARILEAARLPVAIAGEEYTLNANAAVRVGRPGEDAHTVLGEAQAALSNAPGAGGPLIHGAELQRPPRKPQQLTTATLQDPLAHLLLMQQAAVASNEADTLYEAAQVVMRQICAHLGCALGHLWISPVGVPGDTPTSLWHAVATDNSTVHAASGAFSGALVGLVGSVLSTGRATWISDMADHHGLPPSPPAMDGLRSAFAFPVAIETEVVAVLAFVCETDIHPAGSLDDLVAGIGSQLGRVVERQRAAIARQRSDEQLRSARTRLRDVEGVGRLGSWHFDFRSGESRNSEGMHKLYGVNPDEPLDLDMLLSAVDPRDRTRAHAAFSRMIETGHRTTEEIRIMGPDGQLRWHRAQGSVIRDELGAVAAIEGTIQDIDDARLAQEMLGKRERQLAEAQRTVGLGWWERELSTNRLTWSDEMCRLWGWVPGSEITYEAFTATVHPDDLLKLREREGQMHETGEPFCLDYRIVGADGRQRWVRGGVHVLRDEDGTPLSLFGTAQDITRSREIEHELRTAKEMYQRIIETTAEGILTLDENGMITFVNCRMGDILGYPVDEMIGIAVSAFLHDESGAGPWHGRQGPQRAMTEHAQLILQAKDGAAVQVVASARPFLDGDGKDGGWLAMITDITALREAEAILGSQSLRIQEELDQGTSA